MNLLKESFTSSDIEYVDSKNFGDMRKNRYRIGCYNLTETIYPDDSWYVQISISKRTSKYTPDIYPRETGSSTIGFDVQTTSYGALDSGEIDILCNELHEAAQIATALTEKFITRR